MMSDFIKSTADNSVVDYLIHSPVEHFAQTCPNHPAMAVNGETMSYAQLNAASNQLANTLIENGAAPQSRIGLFHHKAFELAIGLYGILKAGCVFVPLDPMMPADRLAFILQDCGIEHVISSDMQASTLSKVPNDANLHIYGLTKPLGFNQHTWATIQTKAQNNPDVRIIDQDLGYIMYTSGSTGQPKGMMHTHHGSISYANWGKSFVNMNAADKVASHAPLHFDLSIFDFFSTLRAGATVVLVPEAITRFPASWTKYIEQESISIVFTVPYTLTTMLEQGVMEQRNLNSLRWVLFGGEPFPPNQLRVLMQRLPDLKLTNIYGPAEAPCCTWYNIPRPLPDGDDPLPIGVVSSNSADLIIDTNDNETQDGEPGELCIRSSTLMRGYWNRPDLNQSAFLDINSPGKLPLQYYRTGDRVIRHQDGQLRFLGRLDRMVKTRGHRVELDEVEAAIATHDSVREVAAFVIPDDHGSQSILAAVSLKSGAVLNLNELFTLTRSKLPPYAIPRDIVQLDQIPHTSSGKIDRRALSANWQKNRE